VAQAALLRVRHREKLRITNRRTRIVYRRHHTAMSAPPVDQRGPGFPRISSGTVDIGAFALTQAYNFGGLFSPVANPLTVNLAKAGSAIPVKFSLGGCPHPSGEPNQYRLPRLGPPSDRAPGALVFLMSQVVPGWLTHGVRPALHSF